MTMSKMRNTQKINHIHRLSTCFTTILACWSVLSAQQKIYWTEGFESAVWPTAAPSSEVSVTVENGTWKINKVNRYTSKFHQGAASLITSSGGYLVTPVVTGGVKEISFYSTSTGSERPIQVEISKDGSTFAAHGTATSGGSSGWVQSTYAINNAAVKAVRLVPGGGTLLFDDITLVSMITPTVVSSAESLDDFGVIPAGGTSTASSFSVSGSDLSANVSVSAPAGFQVSADNATFSDSVTLPATGGVCAKTAVYARFNPWSATGTTKGTIALRSAGAATVYIQVRGTAIAAEPTAASAAASGPITGTTAVVTASGGNGEGRIIVVKEGSAVTWTPVDGSFPNGVSAGFTSALDQGGGGRVVHAGSGTFVTITNLSVGTPYGVAVFEYNGTAPGAQNYRTASPGTASFTTAEEPGISVDPSSLAFGNVVQGVASPEKTVSVSAKYLTPASGNLTVTAPAGFRLSASSGSGFASSIAIPYSGGTLPPKPLYVHFVPPSKTAVAGSITVNGGGAPEKTIAVTGTGIDSAFLYVKTYFVDSAGSDAHAGTIDAPFYSVAKAVSLAKAGDTIYCRGGTYYYSSTVTLSQSGTGDAWRISLLNYPGERPVFNFKNQPYGPDDRGFFLTGNYWYIKGIEICNAGDNGIKVEGNHNVIERCVLHHNGDTGIQLGFGHKFEDSHPGISKNGGSYCSYNYIHNCDAYENYDHGVTNGGNADGFACKMHNGIGNVFRGCRAWINSDDGWDLFETDFSVIIDSCWTWANGTHQGNGNGFKLGGDGAGGDSWGVHAVTHCISFKNKTNNFTNNSHKDGIKVTNCLAFSSGSSAYNYFFEGGHNSGRADTFYNTVSVSSKSPTDAGFATDDTPVASNNSWNLNVPVSLSEFVDVSETAAMAPRRGDGGLPAGFARLKAGSVFIDKGKILGKPYAGSAPDIGPFEFGLVQKIVETPGTRPSRGRSGLTLDHNSTAAVVMQITVPAATHATLRIYNSAGREVAAPLDAIIAAGTHAVPIDVARLSGGVYYAVLRKGKLSRTLAFAVMR